MRASNHVCNHVHIKRTYNDSINVHNNFINISLIKVTSFHILLTTKFNQIINKLTMFLFLVYYIHVVMTFCEIRATKHVCIIFSTSRTNTQWFNHLLPLSTRHDTNTYFTLLHQYRFTHTHNLLHLVKTIL